MDTVSTLEFTSTTLSKRQIEAVLDCFSHVVVCGSRMTEDGFDLFLEGEQAEQAIAMLKDEETNASEFHLYLDDQGVVSCPG